MDGWVEQDPPYCRSLIIIMDTKDKVEKRPTACNASPKEEIVQLTTREMTKDEHHLATLGYKQVFIRSFGMFENWAATCKSLALRLTCVDVSVDITS